MYTKLNYRTKKAMKEAVARGEKVEVFQPNADVTGFPVPTDGRVSIEGPHYPQPHRWYASVEIKDSVITKVLG